MLLKNAPVELRPVSSIIVDRESRQRKTIDKDVEVLADQLQRAGQLVPIIIHADGRLVAGERRLTAAKRLKWPEISCVILEKLSEAEAFLVELLENIARKQLSWQDEASAILRYHQMRQEAVPEWTAQATATDLGYSKSSVSNYLAVAKYLHEPEVAGCQTLQGAFNLLQGRANRALAAAQNRGIQIASVLPVIEAPISGSKEEKTEALKQMLGSSSLEELGQKAEATDPFAILSAGEIATESLKLAAAQEERAEESPILTADFVEWLASYDGPRFDVLHVDFPYGKNYSGSNTRKTGKAHIAPRYKDSPDVFWNLLGAFLEAQDKIAFPIAHCIFWFDMDYYAAVRESFEHAGWKLVQPHPLIWTKPYQGVAADTKRRPRHCYETALLLSRGDRKLVRLDQDYYECRTDEKLHLNQKPQAMLRHFLRMIVDEHTAVLDPTCGSGTALAAAVGLGAQRVLGLELDESNAEVARFVLSRGPEQLAEAAE